MRALLWLFCAWALAAQTATVTGTVTNAVTHEPIEGVSVSLFGTSAGVKTDASGRFRIPNVKAGRYHLVPSRQDFESARTEVRIEEGRDPSPFALTMVPWPGLQGRVVDRDRQPVARARVRAISSGNAPGIVHEATTDSEGRYALKSLNPNQYRLLAIPASTGDSAEPGELAPTWFPGVTDQRDAEVVTLVPGNDLIGYDVVLHTVPMFEVSGTIIDERGDPAHGARVETSMAALTATAGHDGSFELARVRQGEAAVRATWRRGDVELRGFANIAMGSHDLQDVTIRVQPPVAVSGEIELNGQPGHPCEGEAILAPVDGQGERARARFTENGIRFEAVYPGRYRLVVLPGWRWGRHYLDSVRLGPLDITLDEFEVVPGVTPFRVVLRTEGGHVRGTVENGNGGLLVLTPTDQRLRLRPFIVTTFFEGGSFALDNIRPGDYYAFALEKGSCNSDEMQTSAYARTYLKAAKTLRVERNSTTTLTLVYLRADSRQ